MNLNPKDAQRIIDVACDKWKEKLASMWGREIVLDQQIHVTDDFYKEMRVACTTSQHELFNEIFGPMVVEKYKPGMVVEIPMYRDIQWSCGPKGKFKVIRKEENSGPYKILTFTDGSKIHGPINWFNSTVLIVPPEGIEFIAEDMFPVGSWVKCIEEPMDCRVMKGLPTISRLATAGAGYAPGKFFQVHENRLSVCFPKGHSGVYINSLIPATEEEIKKHYFPRKGTLCFVKNDGEHKQWYIRFSDGAGGFYVSQRKSGKSNAWDKWIEVDSEKLLNELIW